MQLYITHTCITKQSSYDQFVFTINNCNFKDNRHITSLVYVENRLFEYHKIILNNSKFISNQGISMYVLNHKIFMNGEVSFIYNIAEDGAGIYISNHSTVTFCKNSNVTFSPNLANRRGGAIFSSNHSICTFDENCTATFYFNLATEGGAIYSQASSNVTFKGPYKVTFTYNLATFFGAAIYSLGHSFIVFYGNIRNSDVLLYNKTL